MREKLAAQIEFEVRQIDQLLASYGDLLAKLPKENPDLIERTALASVLHSFYNGLENVFVRIARELGQSPPGGDQWHRDLLRSMAAPSFAGPAPLSPELATRLAEYLSFRHFYRHSYSFFLDWTEMEDLVTSLPRIWEEARESLGRFAAALGGD